MTIRNGSVGNFGDGIHIEDASRNRIADMSSFGPQDGIDIRRGEANEVRHSDGRGRNAGMVITASNGAIVADSKASGVFGSGLTFTDVDAGRLVRNEVIGADAACCQTFGIAVRGNGNVIRDNRVGGWNAGELVVGAGSDNALIGNELFDAGISQQPGDPDSQGDGIFVGVFTAGTLLSGNGNPLQCSNVFCP